MKNKIYSLLFLSFLCSISITPQIRPDEVEEVDDFDQFFAGGDLSVDTDALRSCEPNEANLWVMLLDNLKAVAGLDIAELFDQDFYKATHVPNYRNVLNFPSNFITSYQAPDNQQLTFHFFFNQYFKKNFTKDQTNTLSKHKTLYEDGRRVGSYLNIENGTILSFLDTATKTDGIIPPNLNALKSINFPLIFQTIASAKLEQRRAGMIAHYYKEVTPKVSFEAKLPFHYEITNVNFTNEEKKLLERELADFQGSEFDEVEFGKQHLIMDALGTGTLDLTLKRTMWETSNTDLQLGVSLFVPTDRRWVTGLYGTYFTPTDQQPVLRVCDIVNTTQMTLHSDAKEKLENFFYGALNHFSANVLQCQMGYNEHLALAVKMLPYWQVNERLQFNGVYIIEYLVPHEHPRFYIYEEGDVPFSTQFNNTTDPEEKISLLEEKLTERLFPRVFTTRVAPGFILNTVSNLQWTRNNWNYTIGYNAWYRTGEKLTNIQAPEEDLKRLNICKATVDSASQLKLFGKIHRTFETKKHDVSFSFYGNMTVWNDNLGNDFTLGISFDKRF